MRLHQVVIFEGSYVMCEAAQPNRKLYINTLNADRRMS